MKLALVELPFDEALCLYRNLVRRIVLRHDVEHVTRELGLSEGYRAVVQAHRDALNLHRVSNRNWVYFSPVHLTAPPAWTVHLEP